MIRGIYTSSAGLDAQLARQLMVANNLANVDTPGYKQDVADLESFSSLLTLAITRSQGITQGSINAIGTSANGVQLNQPTIDLTQGQLVDTGNELDLALSTPGFFVVQTPEGEFYTRAGTFTRDATGRLVGPDGALVMGRAGPIQLPAGDVTVDGDGAIMVNNQQVAQLRIVTFADGVEIHKVGHGYLKPVEPGVNPVDATAATVNQGFLERSNVDAAQGMVTMMELMRAYESSQRLMQLQDQVLQQTVSEVGRV